MLFTLTFAVGNPSSLPRASPWTTTPSTSYVQPNSFAASFTCPLSSNPRIRVELIFSPCSSSLETVTILNLPLAYSGK